MAAASDRGIRAARCAWVITVTATSAAGAHHGAGGDGAASGTALLLSALVLVAPVWLLSAAPFRWTTLAPVAAGGQLIAHLLFDYLAGPASHHGLHGGPSASMVLAHAAAAVAAATLLAHGETMVWAAVSLLLPFLVRLLGPEPIVIPRPSRTTRTAPVVVAGADVLTSVRRRGPPRGAMA